MITFGKGNLFTHPLYSPPRHLSYDLPNSRQPVGDGSKLVHNPPIGRYTLGDAESAFEENKRDILGLCGLILLSEQSSRGEQRLRQVTPNSLFSHVPGLHTCDVQADISTLRIVS